MADKTSLRNQFLHQRNLLSRNEEELFNNQITEHLIALLHTLSLNTIHTFLPQIGKHEVDTHRIIERIRKEFKDIRMVAPRVIPGTREMEHYLLTPATRLIRNRWLIPEPDPHSSEPVLPTHLEVILIPLLGFDLQGFRVGYGGGFYDRFLKLCNPHVVKIGLSFFEPVDTIDDLHPYDISMDYCVTPRQVFQWETSQNTGV